MYTMTETYIDYNGEKQTEKFLFNLTIAEINEMNLRCPGGYKAMVDELINTRDGNAIMDLVKTFIRNAYGQKSADGRYFHKSKEIAEDFEASAAYSQIFMKLCTDGEELGKFINGIVPQNYDKTSIPAPATT